MCFQDACIILRVFLKNGLRYLEAAFLIRKISKKNSQHYLVDVGQQNPLSLALFISRWWEEKGQEGQEQEQQQRQHRSEWFKKPKRDVTTSGGGVSPQNCTKHPAVPRVETV